jgi:hypothetical protein
MNKKLLFTFGGVIIVTAAVFLLYYYSHSENSLPQKADTSDKKVMNDYSQNNEVDNVPSEQKPNEGKVMQESKKNPNDDPDFDVVSNKNKEKFNSDKDEEKETDDGVTVEVESDDE